jgi:hypothetical protein
MSANDPFLSHTQADPRDDEPQYGSMEQNDESYIHQAKVQEESSESMPKLVLHLQNLQLCLLMPTFCVIRSSDLALRCEALQS